MNSKAAIQEKVEVVLADLHAKIDKLKEKVEKLCESTEDCKAPEKTCPRQNKK